MAVQTRGGKEVNNADAQPARTRAGTNKSNMAINYQGVDFGGYVDFGAIHKLLIEALNKIPPDQCPEGCETWTMTLVLHPDEEEGSAWAQDDNPYKTWGW